MLRRSGVASRPPQFAGVLGATCLAVTALVISPSSTRAQWRPATSRRTTTTAAATATDSSSPPLFIVHRNNSQLLFELPRQLLGRDLVVVERLLPRDQAMTVTGYFRWVREANIVAMQWRDRSGAYVPAASYPIVRFGADSAPVIDVTATDLERITIVPGLNVQVGATATGRAVRFARTFRTHVELEIEHRFGNEALTVRRSILALPDTAMRPRFADRRLTYYTVPAPLGGPNTPSSATSAAGPLPAEYIVRRRLEKRNPQAAVSDVVQPIVFYIDPRMPKRWVPWVKRGIEAWRPAFESIGFRNAIVVREVPSAAEDSGWSLHDITHNAVTWVAGPNEDAHADNVVDPRTGEILNGSVTVSGGIESLMQRVGFALLGGANPPLPLPLPDSLLGQLVATVVTHEVGHTLGFNHNFKAASGYQTDSVRSASFVRRMGYSPSLMDYAYFDFVAQPEDRIPFERLHANIGTFDRFALGWGYRPVPGATTPEAEVATLEQWRSAQDTAAYLRASLPEALGADPGDQPDDLGSDLVKTAELAIRNFARLGSRLTTMRDSLRSTATVQPATGAGSANAAAATPLGSFNPLQPGDGGRWTPAVDLAMASSYQDEILHRWSLAMAHATDIVGGAVPQVPYAREQPAQRFAPIDSARQRAALRFVLDHTFRGQDELVRTQFYAPGAPAPTAVSFMLLDTLPAGWNIDRWRDKQAMILDRLLNPNRLTRLRDSGVLPTLCAELATLSGEMKLAAERATSPRTQQFIGGLRGKIDRVTTGAEPVCR